MIKNILLVGAGGFLGSVARYLVSRLNLSESFFHLPLGTLTVNVAGSLVIGILMGLSERSAVLSNETRLFLMVGICGGFTTFSSFTMENLTFLHSGQVAEMLLYTAASVVFGLVAVWLGYSITNLF